MISTNMDNETTMNTCQFVQMKISLIFHSKRCHRMAKRGIKNTLRGAKESMKKIPQAARRRDLRLTSGSPAILKRVAYYVRRIRGKIYRDA
jgi:hypothetical protein